MHRTLPRAAVGGLLLLLLLAGVARGGPERAFWVWNRAEPLTAPERSALRAAGVERLYWQAGELELAGGDLHFRRTAALEATPAIIPVVRVSTTIHSPEQFSGEALGRALRPVVDAAPNREIQLDFDCPDRLLPVYAERLRTARAVAGIHRLTITALAGWADAPARDPLWPAVDAVYPMLYDIETDPAAPDPGAASPCQPRTLLDPAELAARLRSWARCPIPWYASLPVFARVTLYEPTGRSLGHLRSWDWEDLVFNPALVLDRPPRDGTTVLRAERATRAGTSPVPAGGYVAVRGVELPAVQAGIIAADAAGARGTVFFRLPDPSSPAHATGGGWSLSQLLATLGRSQATGTAPALTLSHASDGSDRWVLRNDSELDLPPRFADGGRGYRLELELAGQAAGWREALPGDFRRVTGHVFSDPGGSGKMGDKPVAVAIPLARRLTFWFAELPAHAALTTGLVQLAPGVDAGAVRFRLPSLDQAESTPWCLPR